VPCGFSGEGLPVGMQLAAPWWREATLLRLGAAYQRETDWHLRVPELSSVSVESG
jgi:Asp-tRNA(Asn)/Glu-tRNA(Gln) amidotransferase A subunit family amidase